MTSAGEFLKLEQFNYELPERLIARKPVPVRHESRLMTLDRSQSTLRHFRFCDLENRLRADDVLVVNDTRVIPASLRGQKRPTGGSLEILLLEETETGDWWALLKPGKRMPPGSRGTVVSHDDRHAPIDFEVLQKRTNGQFLIRFAGCRLRDILEHYGSPPLPPYIKRKEPRQADDLERYQTVYARHPGSVAAPTAGLHFSTDFLSRLQRRDIRIVPVTLHIGLGTFVPIRTDRIEHHRMHEESFHLSESSARILNEARKNGSRVIAVGTTALRVLETVAAATGFPLESRHGRTDLFVYPPRQFQMTDALLTNFHLPKSSLLMLVSAFASPGKLNGIQTIHRAYAEAIRNHYRFYSYGDAMFIE